MEQHSVYHLLVLGEGGKYLGMMSVSDLLKVMVSSEKARADMLESYVFPSR
jgi:CBS domain-containing protein